MTDWENQETDSNYIDSLTFKLFCFQFVNSYASLFYIAFLKGDSQEGCENGDCMEELGDQLTSIYITNFFLNIVEIGMPLITTKFRVRSEMRRAQKLGKILVAEEIECLKDVYDTPLDDYMEMVVAYGYIILFGVAFPFVPLMALFLALLEVRVDSWKLCYLTRRPFPAQDKSIGIWVSIIQTVSYIGATVNIAIVIFTADSFHIHNESTQWLLFLSIERGIFILKFLISAYIPDIPSKVKDGLAWSERIVAEKLYGKLSDIDKERTLRNLKFNASDQPEIRAEDFIN